MESLGRVCEHFTIGGSMNVYCTVEIRPRFQLKMGGFYPANSDGGNEMQFDLHDTSHDKSICTNLNVEEAKLIRDRLNEFIQECEK